MRIIIEVTNLLNPVNLPEIIGDWFGMLTMDELREEEPVLLDKSDRVILRVRLEE